MIFVGILAVSDTHCVVLLVVLMFINIRLFCVMIVFMVCGVVGSLCLVARFLFVSICVCLQGRVANLEPGRMFPECVFFGAQMVAHASATGVSCVRCSTAVHEPYHVVSYHWPEKVWWV